MANIDNITKTIETMRALSDRTVKFDMGTYVRKLHDEEERPNHACGTACCLAGFAAIAQGMDLVGDNKNYEIYADDVRYKAKKFLGLDEPEAYALFVPKTLEGWSATVEDGIKVLENLRDNGRIDWALPYPDCEKDEDYHEQQSILYGTI